MHHPLVLPTQRGPFLPFLILLILLLGLGSAGADDLRIVHPDGTLRDYPGVEVQGAVMGPEGLLFLIVPQAGGQAFPVEVTRIMAMRFDDTSGRRFRLSLRGMTSPAPEVYNDVRLVGYQQGVLSAIPSGESNPYSVPVARVLGIEPMPSGIGVPAPGTAPPAGGPPSTPSPGSNWDDSSDGEWEEWEDMDFDFSSPGGFLSMLEEIRAREKEQMNALQRIASFFSCGHCIFFWILTIWMFVAAIQQKDILFAILIPVTCCIPVARWYFTFARFKSDAKGTAQGMTVFDIIIYTLGFLGEIIAMM